MSPRDLAALAALLQQGNHASGGRVGYDGGGAAGAGSPVSTFLSSLGAPVGPTSTAWGDLAQTMAANNLANYHPPQLDVALIANARP
jgi:hypothetical protein